MPLRKKFLQSLLLLSLGWALGLEAAAADSVTPVPDASYRPLETLARGLFYLETMYVDPKKVKREDIVLNALKGIVSKLDPHTMLMPSKAFEQLTIDTQGKFGGVGIIVSSERGKLIVISPIEDTPAYKAGVKSGDEIIAIDGKDIKSFKPGTATDAMRGRPDSVLKLTVKRKGKKDPLEFSMVREVIKIKSVRSMALGENITYARITSFQDNTTDELQRIVEKNKNKTKGMILDLRDNPGGLLDQAVKVSDMFIESGLLVSTVGRHRDDVEREFAHKRGTFTGFPMVVLINGGSASASEIVAGALQDHERALIFGTTSFGKGSVQTLVSLPDRSGLKITVARYYTPKDRSIQAKGIKPDIHVTYRKQGGQQPRGSQGKKRKRKESDLKGHIEANDLSEMATGSGMVKEIDSWPDFAQRDHQLVTAFTYLKGMSFFQKKGTGKPPAKSKL